MKSITLILTCFLTTGLFAQETISENRLPDHHPGTLITVSYDQPRGAVDGYNIYVPKSVENSNDKYPLLIFLQGGLGVGGDPDRLLQWALPKMIMESANLNSALDRYVRDTFIVLMPHIESGQFYRNETAIRDIIDEVLKNQKADPDRIYLTGLSRGGHGSWGLADDMEEVLAAVAPICGSAQGVENYGSLSKLPIWVSHNTGDGVVSYDRSERTVRQLERDHGLKFHRSASIELAKYEDNDHIFTSTQSDSHDAWTEIYSSPNFYSWLLRHRRD